MNNKPFLKENWWFFLILGITIVSLTGAVLLTSKDTSLSFLPLHALSRQIPSFWGNIFSERPHARTESITPVREEKVSARVSPTPTFHISLSPTPRQQNSQSFPSTFPTAVQSTTQTFNQDEWWKKAQEDFEAFKKQYGIQ